MENNVDNKQDLCENNEDIKASDDAVLDDEKDIPNPPISHDKEELAGGIEQNADINTPYNKSEKQPLFVLDAKKEGCNRNDKLLLLSKKIGFFGLVTFLLLSILFGAITKYFENSLNLFFMALAVLSYGVQCILEYVATAKCSCVACASNQNKLKLKITLCIVVTMVLIALGVCKSVGVF